MFSTHLFAAGPSDGAPSSSAARAFAHRGSMAKSQKRNPTVLCLPMLASPTGQPVISEPLVCPVRFVYSTRSVVVRVDLGIAPPSLFQFCISPLIIGRGGFEELVGRVRISSLRSYFTTESKVVGPWTQYASPWPCRSVMRVSYSAISFSLPLACAYSQRFHRRQDRIGIPTFHSASSLPTRLAHVPLPSESFSLCHSLLSILLHTKTSLQLSAPRHRLTSFPLRVTTVGTLPGEPPSLHSEQ